jgi:hypothetical protein
MACHGIVNPGTCVGISILTLHNTFGTMILQYMDFHSQKGIQS